MASDPGKITLEVTVTRTVRVTVPVTELPVGPREEIERGRLVSDLTREQQWQLGHAVDGRVASGYWAADSSGSSRTVREVFL